MDVRCEAARETRPSRDSGTAAKSLFGPGEELGGQFPVGPGHVCSLVRADQHSAASRRVRGSAFAVLASAGQAGGPSLTSSREGEKRPSHANEAQLGETLFTGVKLREKACRGSVGEAPGSKSELAAASEPRERCATWLRGSTGAELRERACRGPGEAPRSKSELAAASEPRERCATWLRGSTGAELRERACRGSGGEAPRSKLVAGARNQHYLQLWRPAA